MLCSRDQAREIIPDHALENYFDSKLIDFLSEIERVCVGAVGRQQLRTDRDDLGIHG